MKWKVASLFLAILGLCTLATSSTETVLVGRVVDYSPDTSGEQPGIHGVEVKALDSGSVLATAYTALDGTYRLSGLPAGKRLRISHRMTGYDRDPTPVDVELTEGVMNKLPVEVRLLRQDPDATYRSRLLEAIIARTGSDEQKLASELKTLSAFHLERGPSRWLHDDLVRQFGADTISRLTGAKEEVRVPVFVPAKGKAAMVGGGGAMPQAAAAVLAPMP